MKADENELFMGLCFVLSSQSRDKNPQSCIVTFGKRIISSGFSHIDSLGYFEGSAEKFAFSSLKNNFSPFNIYIDHTPNQLVLDYLYNFNIKKLVYFHTNSIAFTPSFHSCTKFIRFNGNLNWIRDCVHNMKNSDIFY